MRNSSPKQWALFAVAFWSMHIGFWLFLLVRDFTATPQGGPGCGNAILGAILILILFGPLTAAEFAVGYAMVDTVLQYGKQTSVRWSKYRSAFAGVLAYALVLVVLSLRETIRPMSDNLANSYLGGSLSGVPWTAIFLGGLSSVLTASLATAGGLLRRRHPTI